MVLRLAVMDIAGTTVFDDQSVAKCLVSALGEFQVTCSLDEANRVMGIPKPVAIASILSDKGLEDLLEMVSDIHHRFVETMTAFYSNDPSVREVQGAVDTFEFLRSRNVKVFLDTGFDRAITDVVLRRLAWDDRVIDGTVCSDEVARGRPFPDLIHRAMALAGVDDPKAVAKVGDTPSDLAEGTAAGCGWVVGVTAGSHSRQELEAHPHTHLIPSVADLPKLFGDLR